MGDPILQLISISTLLNYNPRRLTVLEVLDFYTYRSIVDLLLYSHILLS